jgi:hypothetical protein
MAGQKFNPERIERRPDGGNLVQDIDAISVVFDHPLDPSDLAGDPIGPASDAFSGILEHRHTYTRYMYTASRDDDSPERNFGWILVLFPQRAKNSGRSACPSGTNAIRPSKGLALIQRLCQGKDPAKKTRPAIAGRVFSNLIYLD